MSFHGGILAAAPAALLFVAGAAGQSNLATVTGVVTDSADAVIPGAMVSIRNTGTNVERELSTNEVGNYTITNLNPGDYELTVQSDGFTTHVQKGIALQTGDNRRIDVALQIGQLTESVTVDAQLITLNTENGTIKGDVIVMEEIQELPLNGRDFTDLAFFTPGVVPGRSTQGSFASVNGARPTNTNFYVDGFDNRNPRGGAAQVRPNIDALQEFKMETSGYSAEYGRMAGGILNMTLRSGTNDIHGNLSYFLRDDVFDARGFFEPEEKTNLRQNQFSATVTGPLKKNKTFFMFSYELQRRNRETLQFANVPTELEKLGDFSKSINMINLDNAIDVTDPTELQRLQDNFVIRDRLAAGGCNINLVNRGRRNSCFPNDVVPMSRFNPIAQRLLDVYEPVTPGMELGTRRFLFNYRAIEADIDNFDSYIGKIDHKLGENTLAVRAQMRWANNQAPFGGSPMPRFGNTADNDRYLLGADYTHMFSPTDLMELRFGFTGNKTRQRSAFAGTDIPSELGLENLVPPEELAKTPELDDWPRFTVAAHAPLGSANNQPVQFDTTDFQTSFKMTNIRGSHNIKYGFNYNYVLFQQPGLNNARGSYNFRGLRTNHPVADLHLGWLHNVNRRSGINRPEWRQQAMGAFFNDDWKVARKLTLNLGVRWEVNRMPWDINDRLGSYVPGLNQLVLASDRNLPPDFADLTENFDLGGRISTAAEHGFSRSVIKTDWNNFAPRVGLAYRLTNKTVVRTGYGIFMAGTILNPFRNSLSNQFPFVIDQVFTGTNPDPELLLLGNALPDNRRRANAVSNAGALTQARGITREPSQSYLQSWNFTIERELFIGTAVEIDYRGSKGTHLIRRYDHNQLYRSVDVFLNAPEGVTGASALNNTRPIDGFNTINFYNTGSNSIYNAFNLSWRKRSRRGIFWRLNYSWSKSIDDASRTQGGGATDFNNALDSRNLRLERGRSAWDRKHVFTYVGSWELPFGRGRKFGRSWSGAVNALLGGWQLSGTGTAYSGGPVTVTSAFVQQNLGESQRPNRLADGTIEDKHSRQGVAGSDFPFFDTSAFQAVPECVDSRVQAERMCPPGAFALGDSGRNIIDGPGLFSLNSALSKNFQLREGMRLQVRLESFNMLNRTNFVETNAFRQFNGPGGGFFTRVGNIGRQGGPRIFQYALKLRF